MHSASRPRSWFPSETMRFLPVLVLLLAGCPLDISPEGGSIPIGPPPGPGGGTVSYQSDLQPLFDDTCVVCHGSAGGLDLSSRDALLLGGNSGAADSRASSK